MYDITAIGEILIDFTPYENSTDDTKLFGRNPGGAPANLLATVAKYGGSTAFIGKVGKDIFGEFLSDTLKTHNIDTKGLVTDKLHNTTLAFVSLNDNGDRSFSFYRRFGADVFLSKKEIDTEIIKNSKIFHFGSLSLTNEPSRSATKYALNVAKKNGCVITYDPNYRELLWENKETAVNMMGKYLKYADIVKLSKEEAQMITEKIDVYDCADVIRALGPKVVLITDGPNGAYYVNGFGKNHVPATDVNTVDTTGAGDIFFGSFIFGLIKDNVTDFENCDLEEYVKTAVYLAGKSTEIKGAIPSIPDYKES